MKKFILALFIISFIYCGSVFAKVAYTAQVISAIKMYKKHNYVECLQVMYKVVNDDPSNILGYYYIAIAEARLGHVEKAKEAYQRVIDLNTSTQLTKYSKNGIECLDDSTKCKSERTIDPSQKAIDNVNAQIEDKRIQTVKDIVNQKKNIQDVPYDYMKNFKDYSQPKNQIQNKSELPAPTKEEIADALDVLQRAGYQSYMPQPQNPQMTQEMLQMQMLNSLAGNNNNNYNNPMAMMIPYMQNKEAMSNIDPQALQTMMMSSMLNGFDDNERY